MLRPQSQITNGLRALGQQFRRDELAYLALTQKPEHVLRDRLAFEIHRTLPEGDPSLCVCREWKRVDMAILKDNVPLALLEAKAFYTFDLRSKNVAAKYLGPNGYIMKDICKARATAARYVGSGTVAPPETYALVFATNTLERPNIQFRQPIKYFNQVVKYSRDRISFEEAGRIVCGHLGCCSLVESCRFEAGVAFGVKVELFGWLLQSRHRPSLRTNPIASGNPR